LSAVSGNFGLVGKIGDNSKFSKDGAPMVGVEGRSKGDDGARLAISNISVVGVVGLSWIDEVVGLVAFWRGEEG